MSAKSSFLTGLVCVVLCTNALAYTHEKFARRTKRAVEKYPAVGFVDRREYLAASFTAAAAAAATVFGTAPGSCHAFDNGLEGRYANREPQVGRQPDHLGVQTRTSLSEKNGYQGLAPCDGRPNCYCSSTPFRDAPARYIEPWGSKDNSMEDIKKVIDTYEVGQQGIDGGGFQIVEYDKAKQYLYVQFQSYRFGYIDDVEFWFNPTKLKYDVRSASRLGQSDLGVNAKRLEYIGGRLEREFGWKLNRRKNGALV